MSQLLITSLKNAENICWFPSSNGQLFDIDIWKKSNHSDKIPQLFVLTGLNFLLDIENDPLNTKCHEFRESKLTSWLMKKLRLIYNDEQRVSSILRLRELLLCEEDFAYDRLAEIPGFPNVKSDEELLRYFNNLNNGNRFLFNSFHSIQFDEFQLLIMSIDDTSFFTACKNNGVKIDFIMLNDNFNVEQKPYLEREAVEFLGVREGYVTPEKSTYIFKIDPDNQKDLAYVSYEKAQLKIPQ